MNNERPTNKEEWRSAKGYEGVYEVSSLGNFRSLQRVIKFYSRRQGNVTRRMQGVPLKPIKQKDGYCNVGLKGTLFRAHRIVALAFIPNPENKATINHKNGIRDDNRVENLEWATFQENTLHSFRSNGRKPSIHKGVLSESDVYGIVSHLKAGVHQRDIAKIYGVKQPSISMIRTGKTWRHVNEFATVDGVEYMNQA